MAAVAQREWIRPVSTRSFTSLVWGLALALTCAGLTACVPDVKNAGKSLDFLGGPPGAPASVHAAAGNAQVIVSWLPPTTGSSAESYNIYQTTTPPILTHAQGGPVATRTTSSLNFPDLVLINGTTYTYVVTGVDALGEEGSPSSPVSQTPSASLSSAPTLTSISAGDKQITLNWTDVPDVGDATVTFNVYRAATAGGETIPGPTVYSGLVNGTTSKLDTGLAPGTQYFYKVSSAKGGSEVPSTNELHAYTFADPPGPVTVTPSATQLDFTWAAVPGAASYNVYSAVSPGAPAAPVNGTSPSASLTGLLSSTTYNYQISSVNPDGVEGNLSTVASATTLAAGPNPPGALTGLTPTIGAGQITLDWTAPTTGGAPTGYNVYDVTGARTLLTSVGASTFEFIVTSLINGVFHSYVVTAFNADGEGPDSTVGPVTSTSAATPPSSPVIANVRSGGTIHSGFLIGSVTPGSLSFTVEVSLDGGTTFSSATGTTSWKFQLPTGASIWHQNTSHSVIVRAHDTDGNAPSTTVTMKKGRNHDINGDGYGDIVVVDNNTGTTGFINIFHGSPGGIVSATPNVTIPWGDASGIAPHVAVGDTNGDGFADVVSGVSGGDEVDVFPSQGPSGINSGIFTSILGTPSSHFGTAIAVGDFNNDGIDDVLASSTFSPQQLSIFLGATGGIASIATTVIGLPAGATSFYGLSPVAVGDIDGDGFEDIVAGDNSKAFVFVSGGAAIPSVGTPTPSTVFTGTTLNFGAAIAVGDVNGDGLADVLMGDAGTQRASLFLASAGGIFASTAEGLADVNLTDASTAQFGFAVAIEDVDGDGQGDLIVGDPGVKFIYGFLNTQLAFGGQTLSSAIDALIHISSITGGGTVGAAIAFDDTNGDGFSDLVAGDQGGAQVFVRKGPLPNGLSITLEADAGNTVGFGTGALSFGIRVASGEPEGPTAPRKKSVHPTDELWVGPRRRWVLSA